MAKKDLVFVLYDVLREHTDEQHMLTRKEIVNLMHLQTHFEGNIDRRTFAGYLDTLQRFGYDISLYSDNKRGYYLIGRSFEKSEINLLCNVIHSSHMIPTTQSKQLIDKLLETQSKYERSIFHNRVYARNTRKTNNPQFFLNIDIINEAIEQHRALSFQYMKYNIKKERIPRREKAYVVYPYHVLFNNDNYYMICKSKHHDDFSNYRIDKLHNLTMLEEQFKHNKEFDPYEYTFPQLYMYAGESIKLYLLCNYHILDHIIDRFGEDVLIYEHSNTEFTCVVSVEKEGVIFFLLQYLQYCTILEPTSLKQELNHIVQGYIEKTRK